MSLESLKILTLEATAEVAIEEDGAEGQDIEADSKTTTVVEVSIEEDLRANSRGILITNCRKSSRTISFK